MVAEESTQPYVKVIDTRLAVEQQPITSKWLAYELGVPTAVSQKMLAVYLKGLSNLDDVKVTLLITGEQKLGEGDAYRKYGVCAVSSDKYTDAIKNFEKIDSVEVFGIEPMKTKDTDINLWLVDRSIAKSAVIQEGPRGNNFRSNMLGAVKYDGVTVEEFKVVKPRSGVDAKTKSEPKKTEKSTVPKGKIVTSASFFGSHAATTGTKKKTATAKSSTIKTSKLQKDSKKQKERRGKLSFSNVPETSKREPSPSAEKLPMKDKDDVKSQTEGKDTAMEMAKKDSSETMEGKSVNEEDGEEEMKFDDDEEKVVPTTTRRRKKMVVESDSEDEVNTEDAKLRAKQLAEVKETRKRELAEAAKRRKEEKKKAQEAMKMQASLERKDKFMASLGASDAPVVRTKRVLKQVTYEDDKGYLVTKDVYEDVPLTQEEIREEEEKLAHKAAQQQSQASKRTASQTSASSSKAQPQPKKSKQMSMLSFFKRG